MVDRITGKEGNLHREGARQLKQVVIRDCGELEFPCEYALDLTKTSIKDCLGCWSCWIKTPGRCVHSDLDTFYKAYINAEKVIILSQVTQGFVSGNLKTLFDRMLPLFLPYISYKTGESMHLPRYDSYPEVEVYYQGVFPSAEDQKIYEDYMRRTFYQFYSKCEIVKPIEQFSLGEVSACER